MTLNIPLSVRIKATRAGGTVIDRHVTRELIDFSFRSTAPGGFASARFSLHRPLFLEADDIRPFANVYVYDPAGQVVWEGRLEDPGRSAGNNGEVWEVAALGPATHTRDRTVPIVYVDTRLSAFYTSNGSGRAYNVGTRESSAVTDGALNISAGRGSVVTQLSLGAGTYDVLYLTGQDLARIYFDWDGGFSSGSTQAELRTTEDLGGTTTITSSNISTSGGSLVAELGGSPAITANHNRVLLVNRRSGADLNPVSDDNYWIEFYNMAVVGQRYNQSGGLITSGYSSNTVLASEVVADLLGRVLTQYDGGNATIATTSYAIEQLAYPDGVTAEKVLADLMELDVGYLWEAWESNVAGKNRFVFRAWPTSIRYEADVVDGYSSVGSASDLYNAVTVRYRDSISQIRTVRRTQTVTVLDDASLTREAFIDLGDEVSTQANAERAGDQFLAEHQTPANAGRLTIARKIVDFDTGRMVNPWEIKPGYLIRVRGLESSVDAISGTARDGTTIFKIAAVEYSVSDASAQLELDTDLPTMTKWVSDVTERPSPRRR
jgi:hypothetical protein